MHAMRPRVFLQYSLFCQTLSTQDLRRISSPDRFTDTACRYYHQTNPPHSLGLFSIIITPCVIFTVKYSVRVDGFFWKMYHGCPISSIYQYTMYHCKVLQLVEQCHYCLILTDGHSEFSKVSRIVYFTII